MAVCPSLGPLNHCTTLMLTKQRLRSVLVSWLSKDSLSITGHQWQVEHQLRHKEEGTAADTE